MLRVSYQRTPLLRPSVVCALCQQSVPSNNVLNKNQPNKYLVAEKQVQKVRFERYLFTVFQASTLLALSIRLWLSYKFMFVAITLKLFPSRFTSHSITTGSLFN